MAENYTDAMCHLVELYIQKHTGRRIKIVFNDPNRLREHLTMLREAFNYVQQQNKK
jgi:hypothetical protein